MRKGAQLLRKTKGFRRLWRPLSGRTHTPHLELLSLARSLKLYFDAAMCTLCRWRHEYIYIYILYYIYINIMCKYLLKKRKFPRDIYSWFTTSYIWGCLDSIPEAEFFNRDAESSLRSFVFRVAPTNWKKSMVGGNVHVSADKTLVFFTSTCMFRPKKKKVYLTPESRCAPETSWLRFTRRAYLWMPSGWLEGGVAGFLCIGVAIHLVGDSHVSCVDDAWSKPL